MKKIIIPLIAVLLFIPVMVNAAECDTSKVYIDSIKLDKNVNVEEIEEATVKDKTINLNLEMFNLGDNIKYKIVLKNDSEDDYLFDKNSLNINSKYIEYKIESNDNSNILKAKSSKTMYLIVNYKNEVPLSEYTNGTYIDDVNMKLNLSYDDILNPNTGINYILIISLILLIGIIFIIKKKNNYSKVIILIGIVLIPLSVNALCRCMINIDAKVKINILDSSFCMYDFTDTNYEFTSAKKVYIPMKKNMTWNEFLSYATSEKDNRFNLEVQAICNRGNNSNCYESGTEGFNEHINDSNYYKFYLLTYNDYAIEWYSKAYNDDPDDYYWEGIDSYFVNDNFDEFFGYNVRNNLNNKISDTNSGVCYCFACG